MMGAKNSVAFSGKQAPLRRILPFGEVDLHFRGVEGRGYMKMQP
jgi:hypothetical protein